jgi:hypothetical protein
MACSGRPSWSPPEKGYMRVEVTRKSPAWAHRVVVERRVPETND